LTFPVGACDYLPTDSNEPFLQEEVEQLATACNQARAIAQERNQTFEYIKTI
jgi:hypothetical protein